MMLLVFEVVAFGCYLLSSLVAKALKAHLSTYLFQKNPKRSLTHLRKLLITALFTLSIWGSIFGCLFLTLSMVNIFQILLGKTSCHGSYTFKAASSLIGIVTFALIIYISFMKLALVTLWRYI
ncbi:hypothetical protein MLD38_038446 [Melastoma candidum]|nr:hypothetical protein MLD38_038446 [Melastoma candidum]